MSDPGPCGCCWPQAALVLFRKRWSLRAERLVEQWLWENVYALGDMGDREK